MKRYNLMSAVRRSEADVQLSYNKLIMLMLKLSLIDAAQYLNTVVNPRYR